MLTFSERWVKKPFMDQVQSRNVLETFTDKKEPRIRRMNRAQRKASAVMESEVSHKAELTKAGG